MYAPRAMPRSHVSSAALTTLATFAAAAIAPLALTPVIAAIAGCGGSSTWKPPPVSVLPAKPPPPEKTAEAPKPMAPAGPSAITGDLPTDIDGKLAAADTCAKKECPLADLYPALALQGIDAKAPAAVWSHDITEKGQAVVFPKHAGVDVYGVTLKGSVTIKGAEAKTGADAVRWVAFRAPGGGVSVTANEPGSRVVFAVVGGGNAIADVAAELKGKDKKKLDWKARPAPIQTTDLAGSKDLAWLGGAMHARIGFEGEGQKASLGVLIASKDAAVAPHTHDTSWEMLVALRADGTMKLAPAPGSSELAPSSVKDGRVVAVPKATQHAWEPGKTQPLIAVQLYVPGGPEQRFKKLAEQAAAPKP